MKPHFKLLLAIAPVFLVAACGGGDDNADDRLNLADPKVRLVHAVPLGPAVTLYRDDVVVGAEVTDLPYKGASNYLAISTSGARWDVLTSTSPALPVGSVTFDPERGHKYSLIAVPDSASATAVVLIDDPFNKGIVSDNARVRMFNAAFNTGSVDVYLTAPRVALSSVEPTFAAVGYQKAVPDSGTDSIELEGGAYSVRITNAGTKNVIFSADVDLAKNADWLLTSVPGSITPNDVKVLVVKSDQGAPATELPNAP